MALDISKQTVCTTQPILDSFLEQGLECDMILPDYCPDVVKILKCSVTPVILSAQLSGNRLQAEGSASVRLYYLSEGGELCCYEQKYPFEKSAELREMPVRPVIEADASLDYVNCRAMSRRRVDVRGAVTVHLKVLGQREQSIVSGAQGMGICLRNMSIPVTRLAGSARRSFTVREELEPVPGHQPVESILHCFGCAALNEIRVIPGKIIAKGELRLQLLYRPVSEGEKTVPQTMEYRLPISQIMDVEGAEEQSTCQVQFLPLDIGVTLKNEGSDGEEKLSLTAQILAKALVWSEQTLTLAEDCYSTEYACDHTASALTTHRMLSALDERRQQKIEIELPEEASGDVLSLWAQTEECSMNEENTALLSRLTLHLLACDGEGTPLYFERPLELQLPVTLQPGEMLLDSAAQLEGISCSRTGEKLEISCEMRFTGRRCVGQTVGAVTEIMVDESRPHPARSAALTIFFGRKGESVWEIARQYNTSMEAVMEENALAGDVLEENRMLMIPMLGAH